MNIPVAWTELQHRKTGFPTPRGRIRWTAEVTLFKFCAWIGASDGVNPARPEVECTEPRSCIIRVTEDRMVRIHTCQWPVSCFSSYLWLLTTSASVLCDRPGSLARQIQSLVSSLQSTASSRLANGEARSLYTSNHAPILSSHLLHCGCLGARLPRPHLHTHRKRLHPPRWQRGSLCIRPWCQLHSFKWRLLHTVNAL